MANLFSSLLKLSAGMAETGLLLADTAMKTAQTSIEKLADVKRDPEVSPPLEGPRDVDHAVSDLANRVSPPHSCMPRTSTPSTPGRSSAASATRANPS